MPHRARQPGSQQRRPDPTPDASIRRLVVFRALFLGDLICALPALQLLRERFPAAEITLIGLPWVADLARRTACIDRTLEFPGYPGIREVPHEPARTAAFAAAARADGYDLAIQMHGDGGISNGFVASLGARRTLGYRRGDDARLDIGLPYPDDEHELLRWLRLAAAPLAPGAAPLSLEARHTAIPPLAIEPADHAAVAALLGGTDARPLVVLHPGAKDAARRWPAPRFAALADALVTRAGVRIALTGSAAEATLTQAVAQAMRAPALDLAGATTLGSFAALLTRAALLVTNDTGASHLAAATRAPSVVLFGPSRPAHWAPLDHERHRAVDAQAHGLTLARLPVARVLAECERVLERTAGAPCVD